MYFLPRNYFRLKGSPHVSESFLPDSSVPRESKATASNFFTWQFSFHQLSTPLAKDTCEAGALLGKAVCANASTTSIIPISGVVAVHESVQRSVCLLLTVAQMLAASGSQALYCSAMTTNGNLTLYCCWQTAEAHCPYSLPYWPYVTGECHSTPGITVGLSRFEVCSSLAPGPGRTIVLHLSSGLCLTLYPRINHYLG